MDLNKIKEEFWKKGYIIFDHFFTDELMDRYQQMIFDHFSKHTDWGHTSNYISKSENDLSLLLSKIKY